MEENTVDSIKAKSTITCCFFLLLYARDSTDGNGDQPMIPKSESHENIPASLEY